MRVVFQMQGGRFDAASQEASDEDGEDDDEEEDLETMTVTESGDVGEGALEHGSHSTASHGRVLVHSFYRLSHLM